ncbi:hypothetical protein BFX06_11685 [Sulfobacillus thermosulfidooxidans]|nr:hypothetical protein BFX05_03435 [Sulfobacillus thermosulfidooxidans]OLZ13192.1 hypothetical protein BFX06_11685 [Sulfobacillus thermosulfidooxidans]OLZ21572.1 hypothetical protein BFX07_12110 [Sulfobacillus thermosulfidooxidans]
MANVNVKWGMDMGANNGVDHGLWADSAHPDPCEWSEKDQSLLTKWPWAAMASRVVPSIVERVSQRHLADTEELHAALSQFIEQLAVSPEESDHLPADWLLRRLTPDDWLMLHGRLIQLMLAGDDVASSAWHSMAHVATGIKRVMRSLRSLANVALTVAGWQDPVTRLPNRLATEIQGQAFINSRQPFTLVLVDLDGFKTINDTLGHQAGDMVLRTISYRWKKQLRHTDWVGRWGGDEFLFLLPGFPDDSGQDRILTKLDGIFHEPILLNEQTTVKLFASWGMAQFPTQGTTLSALIHHADRVLYSEKHGQKVNPEKWDSPWPERIAKALADNQMHIFYQPVLDVSMGTIWTWEVLVRYQDAHHHLHRAGEFLPALYHHPVLFQLDRWVWEHALDQWARWENRTGGIALPVTAADLLRADFFSQWESWQKKWPELVPHSIWLNVPASLLASDDPVITEALAVLTEQGYHLVCDNFGLDGSDLTSLVRRPIAAVKLATALVRGWDTHIGESTIRAVLGACQPLNIPVIAKGVETSQQKEQLKAWGCRGIQGFVVTDALSAASLPDWDFGQS